MLCASTGTVSSTKHLDDIFEFFIFKISTTFEASRQAFVFCLFVGRNTFLPYSVYLHEPTAWRGECRELMNRMR